MYNSTEYQEEDPECLEQLKAAKWFRLTEVCILVVHSFVLTSTFFLWCRYGKSNYLGLNFRGVPNALVLYLAWVMYLVYGPVTLIFPKVSESLGCVLFNTIAFSAPSLLQFGACWRLYKWYTFLRYNVLSSEQFSKEAKKFYSDKVRLLTVHRTRTTTGNSKGDIITESSASELTPEQLYLKKLKFSLSEKGAQLQCGIGVIVVVLSSLFIGKLLCNSGEGCFSLYYNFETGVFIFYTVFMILSLIASLIIHIKTREIPDPSQVFFETKLCLAFPFLPTIIRFLFEQKIPLADTEEYEISPYSLTVDLSFTTLMFLLLVYPLRAIFQYEVMREESSIKLKNVLETQLGEKLFRAHVVYEFSVENLNFYLTATKWQADYALAAVGDKKKKARNIISRWIQDLKGKETGTAKINISYQMREQIVRTFMESPSPPPDLFSEAIKEVYNLMSFDTFSRFEKTSQFRELYGVNAPGADIVTFIASIV
eukprot:maker-scaffold_31-snap-gene-3.75-mRNA-1 protein AED:0.00 eAED:0.00 QI:76/1/1/1/1/1/2/45/481